MNNETIILYGFIRQLAAMAEKAKTDADLLQLKKTAASFDTQAELLLNGMEDGKEELTRDFIDALWTVIGKSKAVTAEIEALLAEFDGELAAYSGEADE